MFVEEEWNDGAEDVVVTPAPVVIKTSTEKSKVVGKRSLLRTLQTLGTVPDWSSGKPREESESETEAVPSHTKKKKKRCKKRKRASALGSDAEQEGKITTAETPPKKAKKQGLKQKSKAASMKTVSDGNESHAPKIKNGGGTQEIAKREFSRKQWKNKMKNKKRSKNKFLQNMNTSAKSDVNVKKVAQTESVPEAKKHQETPAQSSVVPKNADISEEPTHKNLPEVPVQRTKKKLDKGLQSQMEKLRRMLKQQGVEGKEICTEEKADELGVESVVKDMDAGTKEEEEAPVDRSSALRMRMEKRLEAARFRHINELLYTSSSGQAKRMFQQDPQAIKIYHQGYTAQVQHWPSNPVDAIISYIRHKPASLVVADFGCGDCKIARSVKNKVHCFDLAPVCDLALQCDMAKVPLEDASVDIAVFCLSLMGTNIADFLSEANRVLVMSGVLKIAEVASRFDNVRSFMGGLSSLGFKMVSKDTQNSHFYAFDFIKIADATKQARKTKLELKPCLYKKR